jgi:hypothetical protein
MENDGGNEMRILMILTAGSVGRANLALSFDQVIEAYYLLQDAGTEVVIASSQGDRPPVGGGRARSTQAPSSIQRFQNDRSARDAITDTLRIEQIYPEDFDGAICIGVLEAAAPAADAETVLSLLRALLAAGKPIAIVPSEIEFAPEKSLEGLLITGDRVRAPFLAAQSILTVLNQPAR